MTNREYIIAMASVPWGVGIHEMPDMDQLRIGQTARHLIDDELVIAVGNRTERRYFVEPEHAALYAQALPEMHHQKRLERRKPFDAARRERKRADRPRVKAKTAPDKPKKPAWSKAEPSVKFGKATPGVSIPKYTGQKWAKDQPAIIPPHVKVQHIPSPPEFGVAAKLRGIGA